MEGIRNFKKAYEDVAKDFVPENPLDSAFQVRTTVKSAANRAISMRSHFVEGFINAEKFTFTLTGMLDKHNSTKGRERVLSDYM